MPQATTHYLVTRRSIPEKHWEIWWDKYKSFFGLGSASPDLFYFLLPKIYKTAQLKFDCGKIADLIHHENSYDLFCNLLNIAKNSKLYGQKNIGEKQFAFAFGFYCHVVTDCIFHPYVYRSTKDHWNTKSSASENKHKLEELQIDRGIHRSIRKKDLEVGSTQWICSGQGSNLLDHSIAKQFHEALLNTYKNQYPVENANIDDKDHPIQLAYDALTDLMPLLLKGEKILLCGHQKIIDDSSECQEEHFYTTKYLDCKGLPKYSPQDLFNFSCVACREIFTKSLDFWESNFQDSREFFSKDPVNYLGRENWNLDTGLPTKYNSHTKIQEDCDDHYLAFTDEITDVYAILEKRYSSSDFSNT